MESKLFGELIPENVGDITVKLESFLNSIKEASSSERTKIITEFILGELATILGLKESEIDIKRSLLSMGMDSLMAFEMRNAVQKVLKIDLPITILLEGASVEKLALEVEKLLYKNKQKKSAIVTDIIEGVL